MNRLKTPEDVLSYYQKSAVPAYLSDCIINNGVLLAYNGKSPSIILPETINAIADNAFLHNQTIKFIVLSGNTVSIGRRAFYGCSKLAGIILSEKLQLIGQEAFSRCDKLIAVDGNVPNLRTVEPDAFAATKWLDNQREFITIGSVWIGYDSRSSNSDILVVPESIRYAAEEIRLFSISTKLKKMTLPLSMFSIGNRAFCELLSDSQIDTIDLGSGVREIGNYAFQSNKSLTIIGGLNVSKIGCGVFHPSVVFQGKQSKLLEYYSNKKIILCPDSETLHIPYNQNEDCEISRWIDSADFGQNTAIETVWYSLAQATAAKNSIKTHILIGSKSFYKNKYGNNSLSFKSDVEKRDFCSVTEIIIDADYYQDPLSDYETIGDEFYTLLDACPNLQRITICGASKRYLELDGVLFEKIDYCTWFGINGLDSRNRFLELLAFPSGRTGHYTIPNGTIRIAPNAFTRAKISGISFPDSLDTLDKNSFVNCDEIQHIDIPSDVFLGFGGFESPVSGGKSLCSIQVDHKHKTHYSYNNCLYTDCILVCCPAGLKGQFVVPSFCDQIGSSAFYGCSKLTEIDLSRMRSGSDILDRAFFGCNGLASITLPKKIARLSNNAFYACRNLKNIYIENDHLHFSEQDNPFYGAEQAIIYTNSGSTADRAAARWKFQVSLRIKGTQLIQKNAYINRDEIVEIVLEEGIECIDEGAFMGCCSLKSIILPSSIKSIGKDAFFGCNNVKMYVIKNSYAHTYASEYGFPYSFECPK